MTRPRREFGTENFSYIERDAGEQQINIPSSKNNLLFVTKRKVLEMGLQVGNQMKVLFFLFKIPSRVSNLKPTTIE